MRKHLAILFTMLVAAVMISACSSSLTVKVSVNNSEYGTVDVTSIDNVAKGTSVVIDGNKLVIGETVITATAKKPTARETYEFVNWTGVPDVVEDEITVVANFKSSINIYSVMFDTDGGSDKDIVQAEYGTAIASILGDNPIKTGYDFVKWQILVDGEYEDLSENSIITSDTTLKAVWAISQYFVIFDTDGGSDKDIAQAEYGTAIASILGDNPIKTGYDFVKWQILVDGEYEDLPENAVVTSDITLKAVWAASNNTAYKVSHYRQNLNDDDYSLYESDNKIGTTDTLTAATAKNYEGFTVKTFGQAIIQADGSTVVKIYYNYKTFTVTFGGEAEEQVVKYGQKLAPVVKGGYTAVLKNGSEDFDLNTAIKQNYDLTVSSWEVANITFNEIVHYIKSGGIRVAEGTSVSEDGKIINTVSDLTGLDAKYGYVYLGLNTTKETLENIKADGYVGLKFTMQAEYESVNNKKLNLYTLTSDGTVPTSPLVFGDTISYDEADFNINLDNGIEKSFILSIDFFIDNFENLQTKSGSNFLFRFDIIGAATYTLKFDSEIVPLTLEDMAESINIMRRPRVVYNGTVKNISYNSEYQGRTCEVVYSWSGDVAQKSGNFDVSVNMSKSALEVLKDAGYDTISISYFISSIKSDAGTNAFITGDGTNTFTLIAGSWQTQDISIDAVIINYNSGSVITMNSWKYLQPAETIAIEGVTLISSEQSV